MPVTHTFVSTKPPATDPTQVGSAEWNDTHTVSIVNADVDAAAAIAESKLALNHATHAAVTIGTANGLSLSTQALSLGLASSGVTGALSGTDWDTFNGKQSALTFPLASTLGGTGVNNAGTLTNASNTTITGGGTVTLGGFTLTVPATLTAAGLAIANAFTALQTITVPTATTEALILKTTDNSTTKNLLELQNSTGGKVAVFNKNGKLTIGGTANQDENFSVKNSIFTMTFTQRSTAIKGGIAEFNLEGGQDLQIINSSGATSFFVDSSLRFVGVGTELTVMPAPLYVETRQTTTNAVIELARLQAQVSTAATGSSAGFGVGLSMYAETATDGTNQQQALIASSWKTATNASRKADLKLFVYDTAQREAIAMEASGSAPMIGFFGVAAVVRPTALTTQLTTITHTAPGTPDYALQDLVDSSGGAAFGFATKDEGNTLLSVVKNLQTRVGELETKLQALGLLT